MTLSLNGIPVRVIDKATSFHRASRGSGLQGDSFAPGASITYSRLNRLLFTVQPRTTEVFRFLGILEDARPHARKQVQMRSYKLPGGTEPLRTWSMLEQFHPSPDRPEVRATSVHIGSDTVTDDVL